MDPVDIDSTLIAVRDWVFGAQLVSKDRENLSISHYITQAIHQMSLKRKNSQATLQGIGGAYLH